MSSTTTIPAVQDALARYIAECNADYSASTAPDHLPFPLLQTLADCEGFTPEQILNLAELRARMRELRASAGSENMVMSIYSRLCGCGAVVSRLQAEFGAPWLDQLRPYFFYQRGLGFRVHTLMRARSDEFDLSDVKELCELAVFEPSRGSELAEMHRKLERATRRPETADLATQTEPAAAPPEGLRKRRRAAAQDVLYCAAEGCDIILEIRGEKRRKPVLVQNSSQCHGCYTEHVTYATPAPGWFCEACTSGWAPLKRGEPASCQECHVKRRK